MGCWHYKSARIFMLIWSILLGLFGIAFLVLNILVAVDENLQLKNTLNMAYVIYISYGAGVGGILIINGLVIGIVLGCTPHKTSWMKSLMALY